MKNKLLVLLYVAIAGLGANAFALTTLSFDELRESCQNPAKYHNQIAPANLQVSCKDAVTTWVQSNQANIPLAGTRLVTVAVASDKYNTALLTTPISVPGQTVTCPRYKEVSQTIDTVRATTCDELSNFKGSAVDFCTGVVDSLRRSNPESVKTADTGKNLDLCAGQVATLEQQ